MKEMTVEELKQKLLSGETLSVVDIREANEFRDWHIYGSKNVPIYNAINSGRSSVVSERFKNFPKDEPIVAVCRVGQTSKKAAEILTSMGYRAFSLAGGIRGWSGAWTEAPIRLQSAPETTLIQIRRNGKGCLSYLFGSGGRAAVIDPAVEIDVFVRIAEREGLTITHVFETHVHADHISRARALCEAAGAALVMPKNDRVNFPYTAVGGGDMMDIGASTLEVIATPGHTGESVCYVLDRAILFSGDTIFVESIGRPDLERGNEGAEAGARMLFRSLHEKLLELPGEFQVCPAHYSDAIGFDGRPIVSSLSDIAANVALTKMDESSFVEKILAALGEKPPNFERVIAINEGRVSLGWVDPVELEAGPNRCAAK